MIPRVALPVLCALGLLVSWRLDSPEWHIFQALILTLFGAAVLAWALGRFELKWSWALLPVAVIAAWPAGQLLTGATIYRFATTLELLRWTTYAAIAVLAFSLYRRRSDISLLLRILIIFSLLLAAVSTMQFFAGNGKVFWLFTTPAWTPAAMGPFLNRDHFGSFMALIIPMAMLRAVDEPKRRVTYILAAAAMYASVIASSGRAASLLVTAEILICLFLITIRNSETGSVWYRHRLTLASVFLVAALVAVVGWEPLWNRFVHDQDPYRQRRELALSTMAMVRDRPLTGFGLGTWISAYPSYALFDAGVYANAAHNDWLEWAADGGIPLAAVFVVLFGVSLALCWSVPWAIGIPAVFLHCLVDFPLQGGRYIPAVFFLIFGAALGRAAARRRRQ